MSLSVSLFNMRLILLPLSTTTTAQRGLKTCDIIKIVGNAYFAPFLMDPTVFGDKAVALRNVFGENSFQTISKCHMSPKPQLSQASQQIVNEMKNSGGKWLSIHARAYYDYSGKASSKAFTCAKRLLETGVIKKVKKF